MKNIFDKLQYHQLSDKYGYSDMFERVGEKKSTNWEAIIYESYAWFPRRSNSPSHSLSLYLTYHYLAKWSISIPLSS